METVVEGKRRDETGRSARHRARARTRIPVFFAAVLFLETMVKEGAAQNEKGGCAKDLPDKNSQGLVQDIGSAICCKTINWSPQWCQSGSCLGNGCTGSNTSKCPDISDCMCTGLMYTTKAACSVVQSCEEAKKDYSAAQRAVVEITTYKIVELEGCQQAITGVICAYHFPKCKHDFWEQEQICLRTCQNMRDKCAPKTKLCEPGSNITTTDERTGQKIVTPCNTTATLSDKLGNGIKDGVSSAGSAVGSAASAADAASGGKISSGAEAAGSAASSAASSASSAASAGAASASAAMSGKTGGRRGAYQRQRILGQDFQLTSVYPRSAEEERERVLLEELRRLGVEVPADYKERKKQRERERERESRRMTVELAQLTGTHVTDAAFESPSFSNIAVAANASSRSRRFDFVDQSNGTTSVERQLRKDEIDPKKALQEYWKQYTGKVLLSDFAQVGSRCDECLTDTEIMSGPEKLGKTCIPDNDPNLPLSPEWQCKWNTRFIEGDCTAGSTRPTASVCALAIPLLLALLMFTGR